MKYFLAALLLATPAYAQVRVEANITTVSGPIVTEQGTAISSDKTPVQQPTIIIEEADGPTNDGSIILIKNVRIDF